MSFRLMDSARFDFEAFLDNSLKNEFKMILDECDWACN